MLEHNVGIFFGGKAFKHLIPELLDLACWLRKRGNQVVLFTPKKKWLKKYDQTTDFQIEKLGGKPGNMNFHDALKLKAISKDLDIKTAIFRDPELASFLVTTKYLRKGRFSLVFLQVRGIHGISNDALSTFRFSQLDAWITPLQATGNDVRNETNIDSEKVHVLQYPLQLNKLSNDPRKLVKQREKRNIPNDLLVLGLSLDGSRIPKDLQMLMAAISGSESLQEKSFILIAIHHHEKQKKLTKALEKMLVSNNVFGMVLHTPSEKKLTKTLSVSDALFLIPELEPFSGIGKLGLAGGIPCIAPYSLTTAEILNNGEFGMLYNRENQEDLQKKLLEFTESSEIKDKFRDIQSEEVRNTADIDHFCQKLEDIIASIPKADKALY